MDLDDKLKRLAERYHEEDLEWRIGQCGMTGAGKPWATLLCYVTNRAIMNRLDEVCGPANWKNEFREWQQGQLCGISIKCGDEWVTKWDGAPNTDIEPLKGGLSDSMKRSAVQWGIGRYLYEMPRTLATCHTQKPSNSDNWNFAKTREGKSFYWQTPTLSTVAPHMIPEGRRVKTPDPLTKEELAEIGLGIEKASDWKGLREIAAQITVAHKEARFEPPIRAMECAKEVASKGADIIAADDIEGYRAMVNHYIKTGLIDGEAGRTYISLAASRLELPQA